MKTFSYTIMLAALLLFSACAKKKETPYDPSGARAAKVRSITYGQTGTTETYTYDGQGRLELLQSSAGNKITYQYDSARITQTNYAMTGDISEITTLSLDSSGLATSSVVKDAAGNTLGSHMYTYNQGHKISDISYSAGGEETRKLEWNYGGNECWNYSIYDSGSVSKTYDYFYWYFYPGETSLGNSNKGLDFWGKSSQLLTRKFQRRSYLYGDQEVSFEYATDAQGRITEMKTLNHDGTLLYTDTYTYY